MYIIVHADRGLSFVFGITDRSYKLDLWSLDVPTE